MDCRTYRSPTGELAHLEHGRVTGAGGSLWWGVSLVCDGGNLTPVAGQHPIVWHQTRERARKGYRGWLRALRDAGWQRFE